MKKCPYCAEPIQDEAIKCKHCGEWLNKKENSFTGAIKTSIEDSMDFIKNQKKELDKKMSEHLYVPSCDKPLEYQGVFFTDDRLILHETEYFYSDIAFVLYKREVEKTSFIKTFEKINWQLQITKNIEDFAAEEESTTLNLHYRPFVAIVRSKESEKAEFLHNYISNITFENRLRRYVYFLKKDGYISRSGYCIHENGDISMSGETLFNLRDKVNEELVDYQNMVWQGKITTYDPYEMVIYMNKRPLFKMAGLDLRKKVILDMSIDQDVMDVLLNNLIKNGKMF